LTSVNFVSKSGWFAGTYSYSTSGTNLTLTNTSTAASYLKSTYASYYWKKN